MVYITLSIKNAQSLHKTHLNKRQIMWIDVMLSYTWMKCVSSLQCWL